MEVTSAYPGGSPDIPASHDRVDGLREETTRCSDIKIVDSLDGTGRQLRCHSIESVDGRPHLKQFRAVAKGKPVFIDKPMAASLADVLAIFRRSRRNAYASLLVIVAPIRARDIQEIRVPRRRQGSVNCWAAKRRKPDVHRTISPRSVFLRHPRRGALVHDDGHRL